MAHHDDDDRLYTLVLSIRAWGKARFDKLVEDSAKDIVNGELPLYAGVICEVDPGGSGGPGTDRTQRKFDFPMHGRDLPGEPPYEE